MGEETPSLERDDEIPAPSAVAAAETESAPALVTAAAGKSPAMAVPLRADGGNPTWFTPKRLLLIFCVINMLNYIDRGVIASNGVNGSLGICTKTGVCTGGTGIQ